MQLFVYGTLMAPEVRRYVIGRDVSVSPGLLRDFVRFCVSGTHYPGITRHVDSQVHGLVLHGLTDVEMSYMDDFEGAQYVRESVVVALDCGTAAEADTYVFRHERLNELSRMPWDFEYFRDNYLKAFLEAENS